MKNLLILEPFCPQMMEQIREAARDRFHLAALSQNASHQERREAIRKAHIIIGEPALSEIQPEEAPNLEWIQMTWAGTDCYTAVEEFPGDICLTNATGAFGVCIAEYMMGAILSLYRDLFVYRQRQADRVWEKEGSAQTLEGKTVLVLGAGDIGSQFAKRIKAFDTRVIGIRRTVRPFPDYFDEMGTLCQLDEFLPEADIVACCLPNTPATRGLFGEARLRSMKRGSLLINVGRGNLIQTDSLLRVMQEGHLYGAILDVTDPEPLPADHPLWRQDNVVLTPHISGQSFGSMKETEARIARICCANLIRFSEGKSLANRVDVREGYAVSFPLYNSPLR